MSIHSIYVMAGSSRKARNRMYVSALYSNRAGRIVEVTFTDEARFAATFNEECIDEAIGLVCQLMRHSRVLEVRRRKATRGPHYYSVKP